LEANKETEKLLSPKRRSKGAERQKEEGGISGKDIAMFGAEMLPGVGEAMAVKRTSDALDEKDYLGAGIEATAGLLGIIPGVGDAAGKTLRATTKGLRKEKTETIPVFPKPERMFPEGERPKGGKYLNPITGDDLTGMNVPNANLKINPDGKPSFNVTNKNVDSVGTTGKGNTQIKTNLFKSKAGWKWKDSTVDTDNINTLISVTHKGKHYYTLETDFSKGVTLKNYPESKTEPKLRPTVQGQLEMGTPIGTISVRGVEHPVYDKVITFAEGGVVPMNRQMSMFEDGGLMDEGGTVDPVSGNDVPPGSTQEEVRDDIPAQLSEGEFVFPADVVRYIGLGNLMKIRQEAKMGLKMMDEMGQMGNSEEATMPDDLPFDINDLDMEDDDEYNTPQEFAVGGMPTPNPNTGVYYNPAATPTTGVATAPTQAASQQFVQPVQPQQAAVPTMQAYKPSEVPTFQQTIGDDAFGTYDELRQYKNEAGNILNIPFRNGQPISPIPEGYTFVDPEATKTEEVTTTPTTPQTTSVREDRETDRDGEIDKERERFARIQSRIDLAKQLGVTGTESFFEGIGGTFGSGYGPDMVGKMTGTGYIIGKEGVLIDPLTMSIQGESGGGIVGSIVKGITNSGKYDKGAYSKQFYEALPDNIRENLTKENKERLGRVEEMLDDPVIEQMIEWTGNTGEITGTGGAKANTFTKEGEQSILDVFKDFSTEGDSSDSGNNQNQSSGEGRTSSTDISAEEARGQDPRGESSYGGSYGAKDSTGGSRRFVEGGLASKPKPKKTKKMKQGGLASKK